MDLIALGAFVLLVAAWLILPLRLDRLLLRLIATFQEASRAA